MTKEFVGSVSINPEEVVYWLGEAAFRYPRTKNTDQYKGWGKVAVIPKLYNFTVHRKAFPGPGVAMKLLMLHCDPRYHKNERVIRRGQKLYMDFAREMHTMGLLQRCPLFGYVEYQKALDLNYNVDYIASLLSSLIAENANLSGEIGIQAAMRMRWPDGDGEDAWEKKKAHRRRRRGAKEWKGPLFWLTNRHRPYAQEVNGCWLFGPEHVADLASEIRGERLDDGSETIAVQAQFDEW